MTKAHALHIKMPHTGYLQHFKNPMALFSVVTISSALVLNTTPLADQPLNRQTNSESRCPKYHQCPTLPEHYLRGSLHKIKTL